MHYTHIKIEEEAGERAEIGKRRSPNDFIKHEKGRVIEGGEKQTYFCIDTAVHQSESSSSQDHSVNGCVELDAAKAD